MFFHNTLIGGLKRGISVFVGLAFLTSSCIFPNRASAQMIAYGNLPAPGSMLNTSGKFTPVMIKGLKIYPDDPLKFDFILDSGNANVSNAEFQNEGLKLAKYFLAGLTVPEQDLWVNLSPYEKNRIIPESFGRTFLGRDLLAQDYILKQLASSLTHPDKDLGKAFWKEVYAKAQELYGTTNIPVNTFNKVWIVPDKADVWENNGMAFVTSSHLKVLCEEDYLSFSKHMDNNTGPISQNDAKGISKISSDIVRQLLLPAIEKEINEGENFANLRQIYNAMILAVWYKQALKEGLLSKVYVNQNKTVGVDDQDKDSKFKIYDQYLAAFKKGVFNFIREDVGRNNAAMPRKYFSGGASWAMLGAVEKVDRKAFANLSSAARNGITGSVGATRSFTWKAEGLGPKAKLDRITGALNQGTADGAMLSLRQGFTVPEGQKPEVFTNIYSSFQITSLLKRSLDQIPDDVIDAIKGYLQQEITKGHIKSFLVNDFQGSDVDIHVTHNFGPLNVSVHQVALNAIKAGLIKAQEMGLLDGDVDALTLQKLAETLNIKSNEHTVTERGAESVVISRGINVGMGAVNIKLFHLFAVPGSTPRQKLGLSKAPGVRFTVRRTKDILENNLNGPVWDFEISEARTDKQGKVWPSRNETTSLLALASQPNDYQIVAVYPVEGGALLANEPLATVVYQPVYNKGRAAVSLNPTIIFRSQSGADAVGAIGTMMETSNFVPGGENGERYVPTSPLSLKEARQRISNTNTGYFTVYGYQSRNNGQIPPERMGIIDHVGVNLPGVEPERRLAARLGEVMADHQWDQPGLTPATAEARVEHLRQQQNPLFVRAPKDGEEDPYLSKLEDQVEQGSLITITDDKADMGGLLGHTAVPPFMTAVYRASMLEAVEQGRIANGNTFGDIRIGRLENDENLGVGDDGHMIMLGDKSRFGQEAHKLAFRTFTRAYLFSSANGMKPYGEGQDYQGAEAKVAKQKPYAYSEFSERFFELLRQAMPNDYMWMIDPIYKGWKDWQINGQSSQTLTEPFNGNVSAQGIGSARYILDPKEEKNFMVVAGDKMGPPALNRPIREAVYAALASGAFRNGLVFEIWDAKAFNEQGEIAPEDLPVSKEEVKTLNIKGEDKMQCFF